MESKYYTPKIEELFIGCDCFYDGKPHKIISSNNLSKEALNRITFKFLDKEDIESFGFKFDATRSKVDGNFVGSYGNEKYYLDYSPYNYNGSFNPNVHLRIMKIKDFPITSYQNDYQFIYDGIIKNKSELKKLLIQLGIINE